MLSIHLLLDSIFIHLLDAKYHLEAAQRLARVSVTISAAKLGAGGVNALLPAVFQC